MTTTAQDSFVVLHAIRIKGLATDSVLAAMVGTSVDTLASKLEELAGEGMIVRREGRMSGSMLTPAGKERHATQLADAAPTGSVKEAVESFYAAFLPVNGTFKRVCNAWQMRDEQTPNDHEDADYDAGVVEDLAGVHSDIVGTLAPLAIEIERFGLYSTRLSEALERIRGGDRAAFARPMYDSYHDIWMELHQDLLMACGRERGAHDEG